MNTRLVLILAFASLLRPLEAEENLFAPTFKSRAEFLNASSKMEAIWRQTERIFNQPVQEIQSFEKALDKNSIQLGQRIGDLKRIIKIIAHLKKHELHDEVNLAVPNLKLRINRVTDALRARKSMCKSFDEKLIYLQPYNDLEFPNLDGIERYKAARRADDSKGWEVRLKDYIPYFISSARFADSFIRKATGMKIPLDSDILKGLNEARPKFRALNAWIELHQTTDDGRAVLEQRTLTHQKAIFSSAQKVLEEAEEELSRFQLLSDGVSYWYDPVINNLRKATFADDLIINGQLYANQITTDLQEDQPVSAAIRWFIFRYGLAVAIEANKTFKSTSAADYISKALDQASNLEEQIRSNVLGNAILEKFKNLTGDYFVQRPEWE